MRKKKKKPNFFKDSLEYMSEAKYFIYIVVALFFLSGLVGFVFSEQFIFFDDLLSDVYGQIDGLSTGGLMWFIFKNNIIGALFGLLSGVVLGILPVFNTLTNGALLGYVYAGSVEAAGYSTILLLVPHGVFELPAIFISLGMGLYFGMFIFAKKGTKADEFKRRLIGSVKTFLTIILPLIIIAAIIEGLLIGLGR